MRLITAPEPLELQPNEGTIFLGGTIDPACNWQDVVIASLEDLDLTILNPRRIEWNPEWTPSGITAPVREQVEWELAALTRADLIVLYFVPGSASPIMIPEIQFGLHATGRKLMICCPADYEHKFVIDLICGRYGIRECSTFAALTIHLRHHVEQRLLSPG